MRLTSATSTEGDEWFGELDEGAVQCRPQGPRDVASDHSLVVLDGVDVDLEGRVRIERAAGPARSFLTLPLVEVRRNATELDSLRVLPEVRRVLPALEGTEQTRPIVQGIDFLASVAQLQANGSAGDQNLLGGIESERMPYPGLEASDDGWIPVALERGWLTPPALMPVLSLSLGTYGIDHPYALNDIVNVATWGAAHRQLVVMAAGNCGFAEGRETMSAWAQSEWVLSVGSTADKEGTTVADYSSRGSPADPASGPDLVAYGASQLDDSKRGTSYAAPSVAACALILAAALLELRHAWQRVGSGTVEGIRLVGVGMVDSYRGQMFDDPSPRLAIPALPFVGPDLESLAALHDLAGREGVLVDVRGNADVLRAMLIAAAKAVEGYQAHQVGAGFISEQGIVEYLAELDGSYLLGTFGSNPPSARSRAVAAEFRLFNADELPVLAQLVRFSAPIWKFDWRTQRWGERRAQGDFLTDLKRDERRDGIAVDWPPSFG